MKVTLLLGERERGGGGKRGKKEGESEDFQNLGLGVEVLKKQRGIGFFQLDRLIRFRRRTPRIDFFSLLESDASSSRDVHDGEMKTVALKNSDFGPLRFKERERERERASDLRTASFSSSSTRKK